MEVNKLRPLGSNLLVEYEDRVAQKQRTTEFLLATPKHQGVPNSGIVRAVGKDVKDVRVGEYIIFEEKQTPRAFKINDVGYFVLKESEVIAIDRRFDS